MQGMGVGGGLAAAAFWGFIAAIVVAGIWYSIRKNEAQHETLRRMIDSDKALDQALLDKLLSASNGGSDHLDRDLRVAGLICLFTAPGLALLGWFISLRAEKVLFPLLGAAALVGCISIGLLVAAKMVERWHQKADRSMNEPFAD
jgi:uncharacterized protein DUF6249